MRLSKFLSAIICLLLFSCSKETVIYTPTEVAQRTVADSGKVVVILGSSTAYGTGASPIDSGWVNRLREKFKDDDKNIRIYNLSQGGYTTYHIMPSTVYPPAGRPSADINRNIDKALMLKPDLIIISLPSNDVALAFTDKEIIENYKVIISEIRKHNTEFLVTSTQPRNFNEAYPRQRLASLNTIVKDFLPENIINYYPLLADNSLYIKPELSFGDGIHLNNKGHKIIFEEFLKDRKMRLVLGY